MHGGKGVRRGMRVCWTGCERVRKRLLASVYLTIVSLTKLGREGVRIGVLWGDLSVVCYACCGVCDYLGKYVRAMKAASGMRPVSINN